MKTTSLPISEFYTPDSYRLQGSVVYLMVRNKSIYQRLADARLADLGITASQMSVLMMVAHTEGATISSISHLLGSNAAATVRMIHKLESMDLIKKMPSKKDGRVIHLSLTLAGKKLAKLIPFRLCGLLNQSLAGFSPKEFEQFKDFLSRIEKNNLTSLQEAF